jgi:hypothetical protein
MPVISMLHNEGILWVFVSQVRIKLQHITKGGHSIFTMQYILDLLECTSFRQIEKRTKVVLDNFSWKFTAVRLKFICADIFT